MPPENKLNNSQKIIMLPQKLLTFSIGEFSISNYNPFL